MAAKNEAPLQTAFTVTIEADRPASAPASPPTTAPTRSRVAIDAARPARHRPSPATCSRCGPKRAASSERTGHTEASVDLARLAGLTAAGVICEVMNDDGTMAASDLVPPIARATAER